MVIYKNGISKKVEEGKLRYIYKKVRRELEELEDKRNILKIVANKLEIDLDNSNINRKDCREFRLTYTIYDKNCWIKDLEKCVIEYKKLNQKGHLSWVRINENSLR